MTFSCVSFLICTIEGDISFGQACVRVLAWLKGSNIVTLTGTILRAIIVDAVLFLIWILTSVTDFFCTMKQEGMEAY